MARPSMWAELSRYRIAHRLLMTCHNIATNSWNDGTKMHVIDHGQAANRCHMFVK